MAYWKYVTYVEDRENFRDTYVTICIVFTMKYMHVQFWYWDLFAVISLKNLSSGMDKQLHQ